MKRTRVTATAVALGMALFNTPTAAQDPHLHMNTRWDECSIQLAPSLTQPAWRQFTQEAGLVAYFRPLADARPMGRGNFEVAMLQWETGIDAADAAWNDTFVHPDSEHWLFEGRGLKFPGLTARAGITNTMDVGVYFTKNPNANYGFYGAQLQRTFLGSAARNWAASARVSFASLFGPEDVGLTVYGVDALASRTVTLSRWAALTPYVGVSTYLSTSHEKSAVVTLEDERTVGAQAMVGATMQLSVARLAAEYNVARVPTFSLKVGFGR